MIYLADQDTNDVAELYSVPLTGGSVTKLNETLVAGGYAIGYAISPDNSRVVYRADQDTDEVWELYGNAICPALITPVLMLLLN